MVRRITDFDQVVDVSTDDFGLIWKRSENKTYKYTFGQLSTLLNQNIDLADLGDVSVEGAQVGEYLYWDGEYWVANSAPNIDTSAIFNALSINDARITSLGNDVSALDDRVTSLADMVSSFDPTALANRITSVENHVNTVSNANSVTDARATSIQAGVVSVDSRVTSVQSGLTSVDARITSLRNDVTSVQSGLTSVNTRITSVDNRVTSVNIRVDTLSAAITSINQVVSVVNAARTSLDDRITSVQSGVVSVDARVTSVNTRIDTVSTNLTSVNQIASLANAARTSLESRINSVSVNVAQVSANVTSVYNLVSNNTSVNQAAHVSLDNRITSIANNLSFNLVSLQDVSITPSIAQDGFAVVWDDVQQKFVLSSVGGGGGTVSVTSLAVDVSSLVGDGVRTTITTDIPIIDENRLFLFLAGSYQNKPTFFVSGTTEINLSEPIPVNVTAEWVYLGGGSAVGGTPAVTTAQFQALVSTVAVNSAGLTSVDTRVTSVQNGLVSVDARVTSLRSDITSVYNFTSNQVSVLGVRITSVQTVLNNTSAALRSDITSVRNNVSVLSMDFIAGMIPTVSIQRYDLDRRAFRKYIVRSVYAATSTGDATYSLRRNGTNLTGFTSIVGSVNTSIVTSGTAVTVEVGDRFDLNITTNTSAVDFSFTIGIQKVF